MKKNEEYDFVAYITLPNGRKIYAKNYGHKAFRIPKSKSNKEN